MSSTYYSNRDIPREKREILSEKSFPYFFSKADHSEMGLIKNFPPSLPPSQCREGAGIKGTLEGSSLFMCSLKNEAPADHQLAVSQEEADHRKQDPPESLTIQKLDRDDKVVSIADRPNLVVAECQWSSVSQECIGAGNLQGTGEMLKTQSVLNKFNRHDINYQEKDLGVSNEERYNMVEDLRVKLEGRTSEAPPSCRLDTSANLQTTLVTLPPSGASGIVPPLSAVCAEDISGIVPLCHGTSQNRVNMLPTYPFFGLFPQPLSLPFGPFSTILSMDKLPSGEIGQHLQDILLRPNLWGVSQAPSLQIHGNSTTSLALQQHLLATAAARCIASLVQDSRNKNIEKVISNQQSTIVPYFTSTCISNLLALEQNPQLIKPNPLPLNNPLDLIMQQRPMPHVPSTNHQSSPLHRLRDTYQSNPPSTKSMLRSMHKKHGRGRPPYSSVELIVGIGVFENNRFKKLTVRNKYGIGGKEAILVPCDATADQIHCLAVKQHKAVNPMIKNIDFTLVYPDGIPVRTLPFCRGLEPSTGEEQVFVLKKYKELRNDSWIRLRLFLCPTKQVIAAAEDLLRADFRRCINTQEIQHSSMPLYSEKLARALWNEIPSLNSLNLMTGGVRDLQQQSTCAAQLDKVAEQERIL